MKPFSNVHLAMTLTGFLLAFSQAQAANIQVGDDTSLEAPIAEKSAEQKRIILDRRAYYFLKGDNSARRLRLLDSNQDRLILRLNAPIKPGSYELFVQAPGHKKLALNHNLQVHSPQVLEARADRLDAGGRIILSGQYFGQYPKLFLDYHIGNRPALRVKRIQPDSNSFKYDDLWDKYARLYPTDTLSGESYLEAVIPQLPANSQIVAIRLVTNTGQDMVLASSLERTGPQLPTPGSLYDPFYEGRDVSSTVHHRGELIGWSVRDAEVRNKNAWDFMLNGLTDQGGWWIKTAANGLLLTTKLWREMKYSLRLFNLSYYTEDAKGRIVRTAGVLIVPVMPAGTKVPLVSFQHGTMLEKKQAPTVSNGPELGIAVAMASASGLLMTIPDHLGLGIEALRHPEQFHPYCQWEPLARDNGDMLVAVQSLFNDETFKRAVKNLPTLDGRLFLTGYSEGGYLTLGLHRELESHPEQYGNLKVAGSSPLAGPYALSTAVLENLMERKTALSPFFFPYVLVTLNQTYETFPTPEAFFAKPYDTTVYPLIDGLHSELEVNKAMPEFSEDMLLPAVRDDLRARRGPLYSHWAANDLTGADGSGYGLRAPVHLIHGADDELCPRINTELAADYLKSTQSGSNVDSAYLASNEVMKAAHFFAGQTYHALYAPLAFGESLEWLDNKIRETKIQAQPIK